MKKIERLHTAFALGLWQRKNKIRHRSLCQLLTKIPQSARESRYALNEALGEAIETFNATAEVKDQVAHRPLPTIPTAWEAIDDWEVVYVDEDHYPRLLKEIDDPPAFLFYQGEGQHLEATNQITIVGSRRCTQYGKNVLEDLIPELCLHGWRTVSGFAQGIDGHTHRLTVDYGGETLAVLPCSLDHTYPPQHGALRKKVEKQGFVISEYLPGTTVRKYHFAARNRLLSGLSQWTLVVEAWEKSGTMITASQAAKQNRDLMAVPGSIYAPGSAGCNLLIEEGAMIYRSSKSLFEFLLPEQLTTNERHASSKSPEYSGDQALLRALADGPKDLQRLKQALPHYDAAKIHRSLLLAELRGEILRKQGMWVLTRQGTLRL